jgi:hypothetical protein
MDTPDTHKPASHRRRPKKECCTDLGCESGLRNNYFEGKRLTPEMFRIEQRYLLERRQLLNRAIHGWGVVYGYGIKAEASDGYKPSESRSLTIRPGLALDKCGRELLQAGVANLDLEDTIVLDDDGNRVDREKAFAAATQYTRAYGQKVEPVCWLLSVHYAEQRGGHVQITDPCRCDHHEWDHTCETVRYALRRIPCDDCCDPFDCGLNCDCGTGRCCEPEPPPDNPTDPYHPTDQLALEPQRDARKRGEAPRDRLPFERGGCRCLCDHLTHLSPGKDCGGRLCEIEEPCGRVWVDLSHGVPIACLEIVPDDCGGWTFGDAVDECGPRRLVKRNDLLFDLVRGCDLTRIVEIGWGPWHRREVSFETFSEMMAPKDENKLEYVLRDFWVKFSRPVREATLLPDCFAMTVLSVDTEGGWWNVLRVPVRRVDTTLVSPEAGDPAGYVRSARLVVDGSWFEDGFWGSHSVFYAGETSVEIEVRGDLITDCNGQAVDADAVGLLSAPTGNGTPGGTFQSSLRVGIRPPRYVAKAKGASS